MLRATIRTGLITLAIAAAAASTTACAVYANYPPIDGDAAVHSPNFPPMPQVVTRAFREVIREYPVDGPFLINPPKGTDLYKAQEMVEELAIPGANLVTPQTAALPAYHATRVWVRGDGAEVDIVRPVDSQRNLNQSVTVHMKRKYGGWVVTSTKPWAIVESTPELFAWEPTP